MWMQRNTDKINYTNYQDYNGEAARITLILLLAFLILWILYDGLIHAKFPSTQVLLLCGVSLTASITRRYLMRKDAKRNINKESR